MVSSCKTEALRADRKLIHDPLRPGGTNAARGHRVDRLLSWLGLVAAAADLVLCGAATACHAVTVDFNNASDLDDFARRNEFEYTPLAWSSAGGRGDSGSLAPIGAHTTTYTAHSVPFNQVGSQVFMSQFFRPRDVTLGPGFFAMFSLLAFVHDADDFASKDASMFVSVEKDNTGNRIRAGTVAGGGGSISGFSISVPKNAYVGDRWYNLRVLLENVGAQQVNYKLWIDDYGPDGLTWLDTTFSHEAQHFDTQAFTSDASLFASFVTTPSVWAVDDLTLDVPEPGSVVLGALAVAGLLCVVRQRRRG